MTEARQTARNAGWVIAQRALHVAGAAVFAAGLAKLVTNLLVLRMANGFLSA